MILTRPPGLGRAPTELDRALAGSFSTASRRIVQLAVLNG
jgi:hypothetical protein